MKISSAELNTDVARQKQYLIIDLDPRNIID